ncbi:MAG TPA: argininosuccinate lyase, partial [Thermodesulfobacteriota bacterium]|nr:argininosuccinate lyase [Thermodesulfobacteriota bacterium]
RLWGKRLAKEPSPLAAQFTSGRDVRGIAAADERLVPYDLLGSRAHVVMLAKQNIIPAREARLLTKGLREIETLWRKGRFPLDPAKEDVHSNIEASLVENYGMEAGGKVHTARSRNDQIALDMRLFLRDCALEFVSSLLALIETLLRRGEEEAGSTIPGYTHHQPAQVTTLGHIWLSFAESLARDVSRFQDWCSRFNESPLGAMTGYGSTFPIDRALTARLLAFEKPTESSLDPIQNRWEAEAELAFAIAATMNHLSSLAETLILFSMGEFGILRLDDAHSTGSSMMPQKRNPDTLEVIKSKTALAQGNLMSLLSIGKGLFLGYNRDTQWTKYLIMDLVDECASTPGIMREILDSVAFDAEKAALLCRRGFIAAPDLVEELVRAGGISFRRAKGVLEKAIKYSEEEGSETVSRPTFERAMREEGLDSPMAAKLLGGSENPRRIVSRRRARGGPAPGVLSHHAGALKRSVEDSRKWLERMMRQKAFSKALLERMEKKI